MHIAHNHKHRRFYGLIALIALVPVVGYALMHLLIYVFPMSEHSTMSHVVYPAIIIVLGLLIPYAILKALAGAAHEKNPKERTFRLSDIPKDKDQLNNTR